MQWRIWVKGEISEDTEKIIWVRVDVVKGRMRYCEVFMAQ